MSQLMQEEQETFHQTTAQGLFMARRGRPDILPIKSVLCTHVKKPGRSDWNKLVHKMKYLYSTKNETQSTDAAKGIGCINWSINLAFRVHPDFKSHIKAIRKFEGQKDAAICVSAKQKLNTESSRTEELVGIDQVPPILLWTCLFFEAQGYQVMANRIQQDNKSCILMVNNRKRSSGKQTQELNIQYFYVTNQIEQGTIEIQYCPMDKMVGNYMTKGLQGVKFKKFQKLIMGKE